MLGIAGFQGLDQCNIVLKGEMGTHSPTTNPPGSNPLIRGKLKKAK